MHRRQVLGRAWPAKRLAVTLGAAVMAAGLAGSACSSAAPKAATGTTPASSRSSSQIIELNGPAVRRGLQPGQTGLRRRGPGRWASATSNNAQRA